MSFETRKAMARRTMESEYPWDQWFSGEGIDVGCGLDDLLVNGWFYQGFDHKDGDANKLSTYFFPNRFDVIHASQVVEHMHDPAAAIRDWLKVLKSGGRLICTVPTWELYESMIWPSRYNPDHKSTWSLWQKGSPAPHHCKLPEWLNQFGCEILLCRLVDANFDYSVGMLKKDQTWNPDDNVECWLEFVLRKP